ncbi:Prolyl 4-hydroxylase subunit alpha-1 [Micractinium conductrix]|uniref:procollagen-proline 4-dioxygenase n=1 Tax=Micractinium conductrix TaxID=554055 RepID=A0A2P6VFF0_9CHLO|nr:Prolyl 4-hydroxylase subunit alpha-1 [Micractinium conductrix]|eukprot:PSC72823.1 Prolyl 4-hydroxylase subunit alpha-1 [Micractinium conductrix]
MRPAALARAAVPLLLVAALLAGTAAAWGAPAAAKRGRSLVDTNKPWIEPVSWKPRAFVYHNFMTEEEADHIVSLAKPFMRRSTVVGAGGESVEDQIRTSYGTFLKRLQDPVVAAVEERIATWTKLNVSHQEDMQILRYSLGQKYGAHYDSLENDSPRVATVLLYLSDVEEGGETAFPGTSEWIDKSVQERFAPYSACAAGHVAAKPKKGDAMVFFSLKPDSKLDDASLHTGCPVIKGIKWTATKWIHTEPFRPNLLGQEDADEIIFPEDCRDSQAECKSWADAGECEKNKQYMRGDAFQLGNCRASCGDCEVCKEGDRACKSRNRVRAGYLSLDELEM